ncbi:anoctamin-5-like [Sitophilus oryzae]|uniref:Anoctamin n=1 Tax=Sitophilus oryzae TaxID=7048 RepID=A0A6J2Y1X7_SITOR|nr:anoctamin-5-like [Sitophilus oryzae]
MAPPPPTVPTFKDGKRSIDFILVYKLSTLDSEKHEKRHKGFLESLQKLGLEIEEEPFSVDNDVVFVKIFAPDKLIMLFAGLFDVELSCQNFEFRPVVPVPTGFFATPLTSPDINDPDYSRAPEAFSGDTPKKVTSAEKIMVVNHILIRAIYGVDRGDYGIHKLIKLHTFVDAYPLHDGTCKWTDEGPLNDRQLLRRYWGGFKVWHKAQPVNLIEKYYGTEIALYFAWLGFYVKMLIPASIISIFVIAYGIVTMPTAFNSVGKEICASSYMMCPKCHFKKCQLYRIKNYCVLANLAYLFDNVVAAIFAAVMSIWATVFMEMWQRRESVLRLQWNLQSLEYAISFRPQYLEVADKRYSTVTNKMEPYLRREYICAHYTITLVSVVLLLMVMCLATFSVMVYRVTVLIALMKTSSAEIINSQIGVMVASVSGATLSGLFIFFFQAFYEYIALALTNQECHRTQSSYSNAYIFKSYALAFTNNYAALFYVAFFKGKFFTYPGDHKIWHYLGGVNTDICDASGCIIDLSILLIIIMTLKACISNIQQVFVPILMERANSMLTKLNSRDTYVPQWEKEFVMAKTEEFFIVKEYMDMVIQYGFVTFFIMGFPLAPLFALINNTVELRVDASKISKSYRRPVPNKVVGLGAWFAILQAMTYIGVMTNALVIAFTSNFLEKVAVYISGKGKFSFLNETLSAFSIEEFDIIDGPKIKLNQSICYYPGKRYPPNHPFKYENRPGFWFHLSVKFAIVIFFEHVVIVIKGLVAYAIPDVPFSVRQQVSFQERLRKKIRMKTLNKEYLKQLKK